MDLEELRSFIVVVEEGSFLGAATNLNVSRTTLRRRVEALEARAGTPLLERTQQGVVLTEAGEILAKRGRQMMQEFGALLSAIRDVGHEPSGVLRVVMPVGMPPHVMTPIFQTLRASYPKLTVQARFSNNPLAESLLNTDMIVHFDSKTPRGPWLSFAVLSLREWLLASPKYLQEHGTPTSVEELKTHELMCWHGPEDEPEIWPLLAGGHFHVEPKLVATDVHWVRHCVASGLGIALLPDAMLPDPSEYDPLIPVLPDLVGRQRAVRVTVPQALADIPKIKVVIEQAKALVSMMITT